MDKIRVLVVDDSVLVRQSLSRLLNGDPEIEVVCTAANGKIALSRLEQLCPDVVTLDVEMPLMGGIETLKWIREKHPKLPVIMVSSHTGSGSPQTLEAIALSASDYVTKPGFNSSESATLESMGELLISKIKSLRQRGLLLQMKASVAGNFSPPERKARPALPAPNDGEPEILAIGVSTGGPNALAALIPALGDNLPVPVVIVQHMPPGFTRMLAERLDSLSPLRVREGIDGELLKPGEVWIAPGGRHMAVEACRDGVRLRLNDAPPENSCRPAVDVLFRSVATGYGAKVLGVVLTGMGQDGLRGAQAICSAGGRVLAQDEATSVVWGMPGAVASAGLPEKILPLQDLAPEIIRRLSPRFRKTPPLLPLKSELLQKTPAHE
jgi:two-component system, chemotaxis family, protein-glutamate methylesterase/glutaminase